MALVPWKSFWDMDDWFDEEPKLLGKLDNLAIIKSPKVDIYETKKDVVAEVELPGVDPDKIKIEVIDDNLLEIEAGKEFSKEKKNKNYYKKEISSSFYKRLVPLPVEVTGEKSSADYKDGILKIMIPKKNLKKIDNKRVQVKIKNKKNKK